MGAWDSTSQERLQTGKRPLPHRATVSQSATHPPTWSSLIVREDALEVGLGDLAEGQAQDLSVIMKQVSNVQVKPDVQRDADGLTSEAV